MFVLLFAVTESKSQTNPIRTSEVTIRNCGTMDAIEKAKRDNPDFFAALEKRAKEFSAKNLAARPSTLTTIITIPVVVHVVHPTPELVTEAQVDYLFDRLNADYSGLNADSTNATSFYGVRGHTLIRFTRARRDPNGNLTNGIEKKVCSSSLGILATTYQPIKHSSAGGLDPWDITKYYNIWVAGDASGQSLLGIAPAIGPGNATETTGSSVGIDGVCIAIDGFSNGCYSSSSFNMARTAVHEIGHNFGLFHTFSGCSTGADFAQLTSGQLLPNSLLSASDDTPNQSTSTSGCPSGITASNCSGVSSKMYQNYMDYSNDACLTMFTKGQAARMEYVLENFRPGYLTSDGAVPPSSVAALDAAANVIVSPGGSAFDEGTCTLTTYALPACTGKSFTPRLQVKNLGSTTLTSITATINVNGSNTTKTFTGLNIYTSETATLTFDPVSTLVNGLNTIAYSLSLPNGGVDQVAANDTISQTITLSTSVAPVSQGFESTTFPPSNWSTTSSATGENWVRTTAAKKTGTASMRALFYSISDGEEFSLTTLPVTLSYSVSALMTFDYAYRMYNASSTGDSLEILISTNCGTSWTSLWKKGGTTLSTTSGYTTSSFTPTTGQWSSAGATIDLGAYLNQTVLLKFRARSGYGNNLYVDNISISGSGSVLPIRFISFNGYVTNSEDVQLLWKTGNEDNYQHYVVERSADGIHFSMMGTLQAKKAAQNNYAFVDVQPADKNYYRLKLIENNGTVSYSNIIVVSLKRQMMNAVSIFPNPVKDKLGINITAVKAEKVTLRIMDAFGRVVITQPLQLTGGNQSLSVSTGKLSAGVYTVAVSINGEIISQKLMKY